MVGMTSVIVGVGLWVRLVARVNTRVKGWILVEPSIGVVIVAGRCITVDSSPSRSMRCGTRWGHPGGSGPVESIENDAHGAYDVELDDCPPEDAFFAERSGCIQALEF